MNMAGLTNPNPRAGSPWQELSEEARRDRRNERRVNLAFPIEIFGFDIANHYFTERSVTSNVSQGGCGFELKTEVDPRTVVAIRLVSRDGGQPFPHRPVLFLVSWVKEEKKGCWAVGASKLQPEKLWQIAIPENALMDEEHSAKS
jgi:hypothetical protein